MTSLVVRKTINGGVLKLVRIGPKVISEGALKLEQVQVICPACGQQVEAVATEGRVKGYCAVARQSVDFPIETQPVPAETRAKLSASSKKLWQDPEYRAKISAAVKKTWQNPEYRARIVATHTGKHHTAETKAKMSAAGKHLKWEQKEGVPS